jgi:hypothetical protein
VFLLKTAKSSIQKIKQNKKMMPLVKRAGPAK